MTKFVEGFCGQIEENPEFWHVTHSFPHQEGKLVKATNKISDGHSLERTAEG